MTKHCMHQSFSPAPNVWHKSRFGWKCASRFLITVHTYPQWLVEMVIVSFRIFTVKQWKCIRSKALEYFQWNLLCSSGCDFHRTSSIQYVWMANTHKARIVLDFMWLCGFCCMIKIRRSRKKIYLDWQQWQRKSNAIVCNNFARYFRTNCTAISTVVWS